MAEYEDVDDYPDFTKPDEMSNITLILDDDEKLYVHKDYLAQWSPVFKKMFTAEFKEKNQTEIQLPGKNKEHFLELLYCIYPTNKTVDSSNVYELLPLVEEYQISLLKKHCHSYLLQQPCDIELLLTAQLYNFKQLEDKCFDKLYKSPLVELKKQKMFDQINTENLLKILIKRVEELDVKQTKLDKMLNDVFDWKSFPKWQSDCGCASTHKEGTQCVHCLKMYKQKKFEELDDKGSQFGVPVSRAAVIIIKDYVLSLAPHEPPIAM